MAPHRGTLASQFHPRRSQDSHRRALHRWRQQPVALPGRRLWSSHHIPSVLVPSRGRVHVDRARQGSVYTNGPSARPLDTLSHCRQPLPTHLLATAQASGADLCGQVLVGQVQSVHAPGPLRLHRRRPESSVRARVPRSTTQTLHHRALASPPTSLAPFLALLGGSIFPNRR